MRIRADIRRETGLSVSFGGGTAKLVAKLAVERAKPKPDNAATGVFVVEPGEEQEFLRGFTLAELPMVGPKFQERLAKLGMRTVPDVLQYDLPTLARWLGEREAAWLYDRVRGIDAGVVEPHFEAKSISRDETFRPTSRVLGLERELLALATRDPLCAAWYPRDDHRAIRARTFAHACRPPLYPASSRIECLQRARCSYERRTARRVPARLLGVALSSLASDPEGSLTLFELNSTVRRRARIAHRAWATAFALIRPVLHSSRGLRYLYASSHHRYNDKHHGS